MDIDTKIARVLLAAGTVGVGVIVTDTPASASGTHNIGPVMISSAHQLYAHGVATNTSGGLEHWYDLRSFESAPTWDNVCYWQAQLNEIAPNGQTYVFTETTGTHGCSWLMGIKDWQNWDANYRENTRMRFKWKSPQTQNGDWKLIGDLID